MEEIIKNNQDKIEEESRECQETEMFPDEFETIKGICVYPIGDYEQKIVLLKQRGCLVWCDEEAFSAVNASALFDHIFETDVLVDDKGNENQALLLPTDSFGPIAGKSGVVVSTNLMTYTNGMILCKDCIDKGIEQASLLRVLSAFVEAVDHLCKKNYYLQKWDGHQFYFNAEYESFRFMIDGIDLVEKTEWNVEEEPVRVTNDIVAALLLYSLTGAWPKRNDVTLPEPLQFEKSSFLSFESGNLNPEGETAAIWAWNALPFGLREKFIKANKMESIGTISLNEWASELDEASKWTESCPHCGKKVLQMANECIFCGKTLKKENLKVRFSIENSLQQSPITLIFSRGTNLYGGNISPAIGQQKFTRVLYNRNTNELGLENLCSFPWDVTVDDRCKKILPGDIFPIKKGVEIKIPSYSDVKIIFEGYES